MICNRLYSNLDKPYKYICTKVHAAERSQVSKENHERVSITKIVIHLKNSYPELPLNF